MRLFQGSELILATHNQVKIPELRMPLEPFGIKVQSAAALALPEVEETGTTFIDNALIKARHVAKLTNKPSLGDDTGLVIPSLNGKPGLHSGRWAKECGGFHNAWAKLEELLQNKDKSAYFECAIALVWPDGHSETFFGTIHGHLDFPPRGRDVKNYDPIFVPKGYSQTFAEMSFTEKQRISHRAIAMTKLIKNCFKRNYPNDSS